MTTSSRKVTHDIACAYYKLNFKCEKKPNQPRGKFSHYLKISDVFDFIAQNNHKDLVVTSLKGRYVFSIKEVKKKGNNLLLLIERSDKEHEDVRIYNRPSDQTKLVPFEDGDELQRFFHVVVNLDAQAPFSSSILVEQYAGGTGYTFAYILTKILHDFNTNHIQPDFFKVPYEGGGLNEDGTPRLVEFRIKANVDNVAGISLLDRAAEGNLLSISAIEETKKSRIESDPMLVIAKKEFKYIPQQTVFLDQNGQILERGLLQQAMNSVLSKIKKDASLGEDFFYRIRCKEKSRMMSVDIKGDYEESDFGVKIDFIEQFERQTVTQDVKMDEQLFDKMIALLAAHVRSESSNNEGSTP
ncbi:hypothetical protein ACLILV_00340 [Acinetobacter johnsonii]|jgi:hypothetical protein|uniref:hypothetical protein n=1 Tax=Acinetobacter johnsonii TaxID=40214 RepID=UPI003984C252